eukprot:gene838-268_t
MASNSNGEGAPTPPDEDFTPFTKRYFTEWKVKDGEAQGTIASASTSAKCTPDTSPEKEMNNINSSSSSASASSKRSSAKSSVKLPPLPPPPQQQQQNLSSSYSRRSITNSSNTNSKSNSVSILSKDDTEDSIIPTSESFESQSFEKHKPMSVGLAVLESKKKNMERSSPTGQQQKSSGIEPPPRFRRRRAMTHKPNAEFLEVLLAGGSKQSMANLDKVIAPISSNGARLDTKFPAMELKRQRSSCPGVPQSARGSACSSSSPPPEKHHHKTLATSTLADFRGRLSSSSTSSLPLRDVEAASFGASSPGSSARHSKWNNNNNNNGTDYSSPFTRDKAWGDYGKRFDLSPKYELTGLDLESNVQDEIEDKNRASRDYVHKSDGAASPSNKNSRDDVPERGDGKKDDRSDEEKADEKNGAKDNGKNSNGDDDDDDQL